MSNVDNLINVVTTATKKKAILALYEEAKDMLDKCINEHEINLIKIFDTNLEKKINYLED